MTPESPVAVTQNIDMALAYLSARIDDIRADLGGMRSTMLTRSEFDSSIKNLTNRVDRLESAQHKRATAWPTIAAATFAFTLYQH